jgi:hypothetical protein
MSRQKPTDREKTEKKLIEGVEKIHQPKVEAAKKEGQQT